MAKTTNAAMAIAEAKSEATSQKRSSQTGRLLWIISSLGLCSFLATNHATGNVLQARGLAARDDIIQSEVYTETLFVPSLAHSDVITRPNGMRVKALNATFSQKIPVQQCEVPRQLIWEWNRYSQKSISDNSLSQKLLIGVYYDEDRFADSDGNFQREVQKQTSAINKAYGQEWNADVVVLGATATDRSCSSNQRMSLLRLRLLFYAADRSEDYDQLLLLDSNAMITNMNYDLSTLIEHDDIVVAPKILESDAEHTFRVNPRIMLWNLKHPGTKIIAREWFDAVLDPMSDINQFAPFKGRYLQYVLRQYPSHVRALDWEFSHRDRGAYITRYYKDDSEHAPESQVLQTLSQDVRGVTNSL